MNDSSASAVSRSNQPLPALIQSPCVSVSFALSGQQLPADHGYLIYSAIARTTGNVGVPAGSMGVSAGSAGILPAGSPLHKTDWLGIELISGFPSGPGLIALPDRGATLRLRIPVDHYRDVLPLAGKRLDIGGHQIRLGLPVARPLEPAPSLYARVVTIKKFTEAEPFIEAVKRKLDSFGIKGRVELPLDVAQTVSLRSDADSKLKTENSKLDFRYRRRIVTIHGKSVVGFSVAVHDLNDDDSLLLQAGAVKVIAPEDGSIKWQSIFSRRAMGCGIFNPIVRQMNPEE